MLKISVITVCYNSRSTIEETILSVINQTYSNVEYIIVDGASKDGTQQILEKYKDDISLVVSEPDNGVYDAMNKGLNLATGDFLMFLGSDDHLISYDTIKLFVDKIADRDKIYYGDVYRNESNDIYRGPINKYSLCMKNVCHQAIFYPKSIYKTYQYDERYKIYADYIYNLNMFPKIPFQYIHQTISFFNCYGLSGQKNDAYFQKNIYGVIYKNYGILGVVVRYVHEFLYECKKRCIHH
jgi:glycosyltransferase involved in cell wall biosynthesis